MSGGFMKKCKICCLEEDGLLNLWDEYKSYGDTIVYGDMIKECFSISIQKPELDEEFICDSCISHLKDAVNFKDEILASDSSLRDFKNGPTLKYKSDSDNVIKTEYLDIECLLDDNCKDLGEALFSDYDEEVEIEEAKNILGKPHSYMQKCLNNLTVETKSTTADAAATISKPVKVVMREAKSLTKREGRRNIFKCIQEQIVLNNITKLSNATPIKAFNGRAYECYFCPNAYELPADLKKHTLTEHRKSEINVQNIFDIPAKIDVTDLTCVICNTNVKLITDLCEHLKKEHDKPYDDSLLNFLIPINFRGEGLKCAICRESFPYFKLLFEHMKKHFRNYECEPCGCFFITKRTLTAHMRRHASGEYKCSYCHKIFYTKHRVKAHADQVHLKKKRNKCVYCDEKFIDLMRKKEHEFQVHGAKKVEFPCQACEKMFKSQKSLSDHIKRYHLMARHHRCTMCEKQFSNSGDLKQHMVTHTKSKDFICSVCKKGYGRQCTLKEHMRIHLNDRRFKCDICGFAFIQKCSLKSHMASKHPHYSEF